MNTNDLINLNEDTRFKIDSLLSAVENRIDTVLQKSSQFRLSNLVDARTAASYHFSVGGKRLRARLAITAGINLGLADTDIVCIASCVELLHNASLIHDDIQDRDQYRRNQKSVWNQFNKDIAICSGDLLLSSAYAVLARISNLKHMPAMLDLIHERTTTTICGQCADLSESSKKSQCIDDYIKIAGAKSGALLSLPLELVLTASQHSEKCGVARLACEHFSVSYQISDDLDDHLCDNVNIGCVEQDFGFNILQYSNKKHSKTEAIDVAIDLARKHLALCDIAAGQLPLDVGATLLSLSANLNESLNKRSSKVFN